MLQFSVLLALFYRRAAEIWAYLSSRTCFSTWHEVLREEHGKKQMDNCSQVAIDVLPSPLLVTMGFSRKRALLIGVFYTRAQSGTNVM